MEEDEYGVDKGNKPAFDYLDLIICILAFLVGFWLFHF